MKFKVQEIPSLFKDSAKEFGNHNPLLVAAAISFYVLLSLGPILFIIMLSLGSIFGERAVQGQIVNEIQNVVGQKPAEIIQSIISRVYKFPSKTITLLSSIPLLFFGGTMIFFQIRNALNIMWEVEPPKQSNGLLRKIKSYSFSFLMLLIVGIIILLLVLKSPALSLLNDSIPMSAGIIKFLDLLSNVLVITFLFGMIYKILPAAEIKWSDVLVGASVTAILFSIVQVLIGINVSNSNIENAAGAIGSFTILFLWIFYSTLIFLFGANFTKIYAKRFGSFKEL